MGGFFRLVGVLLVVLTIIYVSLSLYSRSVRRDKLEQQWEDEGMEGDKREFVRAGLRQYDGSLRRKLILGVYVVPVAVIGTIIYVINHSN